MTCQKDNFVRFDAIGIQANQNNIIDPRTGLADPFCLFREFCVPVFVELLRFDK